MRHKFPNLRIFDIANKKTCMKTFSKENQFYTQYVQLHHFVLKRDKKVYTFITKYVHSSFVSQLTNDSGLLS